MFHEALPFVELDAEALVHVDTYKTRKHRLPLLKPVLYHQLRPLPLIPTKQDRHWYRSHNEDRYQHIRNKVAHVVVALADCWKQYIRIVISGNQKVQCTHCPRYILELYSLVCRDVFVVDVAEDPVAHESEEEDDQGNEEEEFDEVST